jgi:hypothetical protein
MHTLNYRLSILSDITRKSRWIHMKRKQRYFQLCFQISIKLLTTTTPIIFYLFFLSFSPNRTTILPWPYLFHLVTIYHTIYYLNVQPQSNHLTSISLSHFNFTISLQSHYLTSISLHISHKFHYLTSISLPISLKFHFLTSISLPISLSFTTITPQRNSSVQYKEQW